MMLHKYWYAPFVFQVLEAEYDGVWTKIEELGDVDKSEEQWNKA